MRARGGDERLRRRWGDHPPSRGAAVPRERGYRVAFAPLKSGSRASSKRRTATKQELRRLECYQLLIVDEVGYLPLERQAANLLFALVSRRYERGSIIATSNRGFEQWGEILGDAYANATGT